MLALGLPLSLRPLKPIDGSANVIPRCAFIPFLEKLKVVDAGAAKKGLK